ncbi:hypothetical protein SEA_STEAMY_36 [Mycobacterium phage Steamy]|uniref:Uncharacterized protein n=1 Tax=Mycobacterium phage Steamy TaxID=2250309 RepID=A0A345L0K9_9CAUD|nr:hypothetical protein KIV62_gp65 [Mycobacterium phage Steamy]AXH48811.1 hypothetical protein SEA_STEAMY_36 [Mycobacterium phage Steamy]
MRWLKRLFAREPAEPEAPFTTVEWHYNPIMIRITDPIWYTAPNGDRVQVLPDGSEVRYTSGQR